MAMPANTNALMNRISFVQSFYPKSEWTSEEAQYVRRGFVAGVIQGWDNADGSRQSIALARFATPAGATSAFDEVSSFFKQKPKPMITSADPAIGAVGLSNPTLDSWGDAHAEWVAVVGNTMVFVIEYTAATPDPAAAKALLHQQYDSLRNGS
jgi:hypothetical protein